MLVLETLGKRKIPGFGIERCWARIGFNPVGTKVEVMMEMRTENTNRFTIILLQSSGP
jgi:hypothetical protein